MTLECDLAAGIDSVGWLALADLCEERGALLEAKCWRRRAACLRAVLELRKVAESAECGRLYRFELRDGWAVSAYCTRREVRASLLRDRDHVYGPGKIGHYHLHRTSLLGRTQRSPKLAQRYLRVKACQLAKMIELSVDRG